MNLILGLAAGALVGWVACMLFRFALSRTSAVVLGSIAGGVGTQLSSMLTSTPGSDGAPDIFALVVASAAASACIVVASMISSR